MSVSEQPIAIVGNGVSGLIAFATLRFLGAPTAQIAIYGDHADPLAQFKAYTGAIAQQDMRSESNGHLLPTDFPGFATLLLVRRAAPLPFFKALFDLYHPLVTDVFAQGDALSRQTGLSQSFVRARVGCVERRDGYFALWDEAGQPLGQHRHVLLALGYAGLAWPDAAAAARADPALRERVVHTYEPKSYRAGETVAIIGAGIGAVHDWLNVLDAGGRVVAIWRQAPIQQPLNAERCMFNAAGIDGYRRMSPDGRLAVLRQVGLGTYPWRAGWERQLWAARHEGRLQECTGEVTAIRPQSDASDRLVLDLANGDQLNVDRVIAAVGLVGDPLAHPVVARLVADYALPLYAGQLVVADNMTLPKLSRPDSVMAVSGMLARWAYPGAATFVGMKVAARAFARLAWPDSRLSLRLANWWRLVTDRTLAA
jgi:hypothetical protein